MTLRSIPVEQACQMIGAGAVLIDVREAYEFNAEHIEGGILYPLSALPHRIETHGRAAIFYCKSGMRTTMAASRLVPLVSTEAFVLQGGIDAWKRAGQATAGGGQNAVVGATLLRRLLSAVSGRK